MKPLEPQGPENEDGARDAPPDAASASRNQHPEEEPVADQSSDRAAHDQHADVGHPGQLALPLPGLAEVEDQTWNGEEGIAELAALGTDFTADNLRKITGVPSSRNKIGAAFIAAQRRGDIVAVGIGRSGSRSRHAGKLTIWRGAA